jgi:hypothetical protein
MPLHVSSTVCSSSGGQNCIIQHLVSSHSVGGTKSCFIISLLYASTCFEHYVLIIRRPKLYYTASGIATHCRWHKFLFYNKFIVYLNMFRALCAHHQEVKIVLYSIWYRHTRMWSSRAQVERDMTKPDAV